MDKGESVDFGSLGAFALGFGTEGATQDSMMSSNLDLFTTVPTEAVMHYPRDGMYRPTSLNAEGPFVFSIPSEGNLYIDLQSFRLEGLISVSKWKASETKYVKVESTDKVAPVNNFPQTFFRSVETDINGKY